MPADEDENKGVSMDRRTLLRGTAATGLVGVGAAGSASGHEGHGDDHDGDGHGEGGKDGHGDGKDGHGHGHDHGKDGDGKVGHDHGKGGKDGHDHDDGKDGSDEGGHDKPGNEITFCAAGKATFGYYVKVGGAVERGGTYQSDEWDKVGRNYVKGAVSKGRCDSFRFSGSVKNLKLRGPGQVKVNGEVVKDTRKAAQDDDDAEQRLPKVVAVSSPGTDELLEYTFRVTGDLVNLEPDEDTGNAVDEVIDLGDRGTRVQGAVSTGDDRFAFSGDLVREQVPPGVQLAVGRR